MPARATRIALGKGFQHGSDRHGQILQHRKGFGFIKPDNGGADIFVHISAVQASGLSGLVENQKVSYDMEPDKRGKGPKAVNLQADD